MSQSELKITNGTPEEIWLERQYDGKFGHIFVFMIRFADGLVGEYHSKSNAPEKFKVGEARNFTIELKENQGVTYNKIAPYDPNAINKRLTNKTMEKDPKEQLSIARQVAQEWAIEFALTKPTVVTDKAQFMEIVLGIEEWITRNNPDTNLSIKRSAAISRAVKLAKLPYFSEINSLETLLAQADKNVGYYIR